MGRPPNYPRSRTRPYSVHVRNADQHPTPWAAYIHEAMSKRGWSVARLAREVGVHPGTVFRWLNGSTRNVGSARVRRVAAALGDDVNVALRAAGAQPEEPKPQIEAPAGGFQSETEQEIWGIDGLTREDKEWFIAVLRERERLRDLDETG